MMSAMQQIRHLAFAMLSVAALSTASEATILAQWVQLGRDGAASVRAITDETACPAMTFDGTSMMMAVRSQLGQKFDNVKDATFDVLGCEIDVPQGAQAAVLDGKPLALPKPNPRRIMIFGDTGCRLLGRAFQNCNDPDDWPFAKIAALAAAAQPDLVIHVGDCHYRESACPIDNRGCAGIPSGYGFDTWRDDFFDLVAPLLAAGPWVLVRGNHEDCNRAGEGWFRFLDHAPMEAACRDLTGAFVARLGDFGVVVVDGAKPEDPKGDATALIDTLRRQFVEIADKIPVEAWLASHRPLNAMEAGGGSEPPVLNNKVQEAALGPVMPASVRMHVAGHVHFFQAIDFGGVRPPTLVVGTGGDALVTMAPMSATGADINGVRVIHSATRLGFGYMIFEREDAAWTGTVYDVDGNAIDRCRLVERSLTCGS
jgi:hypothetical protein